MKGGMTTVFSKEADIAASKYFLNYILSRNYRGKHGFPCLCYHQDISCSGKMQHKTLVIMLSLLKINIPIHVLPLLIFKMKHIKTK